MGPIGVQEMIAVFVIALILFGPKKLPELGRIIGKGLSEFRRAKSELTKTFESHLNELERETRITTSPTTSITEHSPPTYSYPYDENGAYASSNSPEIASVPAAPVHSPEQPLEPAAEVRQESVVRALPLADTVPRGNGAFHGEHHS